MAMNGEHKTQRLKIEYLPISDLRPYANNPRDNEDAIGYVAASISRFGFINPVVVTMDGEVLAGHTRIKSALALGETEVPVVRVDLTADEARAYRLADNKVGEHAKWIADMLAQEADLLKDSGIDLSAFGFDTDALADLLTPVPDMDGLAAETDTSSIPARTQTGDVWRLGNHVLMCGDSTSEADVARLMGGEKADCLVTDPPYNVAIVGGTADKLTIENDDMDEDAFRLFLTRAFKAAADALKPGAAGYVWHSEMHKLAFLRAVSDAGLDMKQTLIWVKNHFTMSWSDYQWRHEPCLYVRKPGAAHYFTEDRTKDTVMESDPPDLDAMSAEAMRNLLRRVYALRYQSVLRFGKPVRNGEHPTEKPIGLLAQLMRDSSRRGEIVLDLFGGSGTTLIAAERSGRKCRMMELDPKYATVIIDRWEAETGEKAERIGEG